MTVVASAPSRERNSSGPIHWKVVQLGLWVGKDGTEFAGMIESTRGGGFAAMTCLGEQLGTFSTVDAAKQSFAA